MINHVVLFKLKEFDTREQKQESLEKFKTMLYNLQKHIPELKHIEVGLHYVLESPSFDLSLITHFESLADLDVYRVHPEHKKVIEYVNTIVVERAAVDYEF